MSLIDKQEVEDICRHTALPARKWSGFTCVNVHSVQVVVAVVCNDDLVCMVCKCTAVCHVLLGYIGLLHPCFLPFCLCCGCKMK